MKENRELQFLYYEIITDMFKQESLDNRLIEKMLHRLSEYLKMDYLALYLHFETTNSLQLLAAVSRNDHYVPEEFITNQDIIPNHFFKGERPEYVRFIPIQLEDSSVLFLLYDKPISLKEQALLLLRKETENSFSIIKRMWATMLQHKYNTTLVKTSMKMLMAHDKSEVLHQMVEALESVYHDYPFYLTLTQEYGVTSTLPIKILKYTDTLPMTVSAEVFMTGKFQIEVEPEQGTKTAYAPIAGEQSVYGVLELIMPIADYFPLQEQKFIEEFAFLAGKALEKTMLYEDSLSQVSELTLLNNTIHDLNAALKLEELTELIRKQIMKITGATEVGFIYFDEKSDKDFDILIGSTALFQEIQGQQLANEYKVKIMKTREAIFTGNATELEKYGYQSVMVIPMVYSGLSMGFAIVLHKNAYYFSFENFKLIVSLMQHSALAISNTILKERLQTTVITDYLTQVYTRRYLEETINDHEENGATGVLLLFDIDNFKSVNDTYGHHVGDRVLKQTASVMEKAIGNDGIVARWGGEEFAVYLPELALRDAQRSAGEIRKQIPLGTDPSITVSCGISSWYRGEHVTQESLFKRADQALYQAKSKGKNRVLTL